MTTPAKPPPEPDGKVTMRSPKCFCKHGNLGQHESDCPSCPIHFTRGQLTKLKKQLADTRRRLAEVSWCVCGDPMGITPDGAVCHSCEKRAKDKLTALRNAADVVYRALEMQDPVSREHGEAKVIAMARYAALIAEGAGKDL